MKENFKKPINLHWTELCSYQIICSYSRKNPLRKILSVALLRSSWKLDATRHDKFYRKKSYLKEVFLIPLLNGIGAIRFGVWGKVFWGRKWIWFLASKILLTLPLIFRNFFPGTQSMYIICPAEKEEEETTTKVVNSDLWGGLFCSTLSILAEVILIQLLGMDHQMLA